MSVTQSYETPGFGLVKGETLPRDPKQQN